MPTLSIGDKSVTVGDEFLKLSPDQQNATVQEIAASIGVKPSAPAAPVTANDVVSSAASGVPILGGALNHLDAATNAALAPVLNRFFKPEDQLQEGTFSERMAHSLRDLEGRDKRFAEQHPVIDTGAKLAGGVAALGPVMGAAPEAFGLAGPMSQMIRNGAVSGAALSAADAAVRGENPVEAAGVGGLIGAAGGPVGRGVGKVVSAVADRVRPLAAPSPQNLVNVAGVDVPLSAAEVSQNPALSAEQQIIARGGRGEPAQERAQGFRDLQDARVNEARDTIAAGLDPTGAALRTSPQDAAEKIAAELISQEQARQASEAGVHAGAMSPAQQGVDIARSLGGGTAAPNAADAAEILSNRLAVARDAAKKNYRGKYDLTAQQPGEFAPGSAEGFRSDVESGLRAGDNPVSLDATNTPKALNALRVIDENLNAAGPAAVKPVEGGGLGPQHAQDVAAIRDRFGDQVAAAYDRQKQAQNVITSPNDVTAPKGAQSLLEFIASRGGLGPDSELQAIGAHSHTVNVEGAGRRKLVKQGGDTLDYAREAATEAGYLPEGSTPRDFLDAIDAEMRGQKRFPAGFEGSVSKREAAALSEREAAELDRHIQGFHDDLAAAGHGELGPDVKDRAVKLMSREGMDADTAVEHALHQLEQEDAAGLGRAAGFPGDRPAAAAAAVPKVEAPASGFTMRDVEQVRKQLSTLYGDARRAMMAGGSGSDLHALEHIIDQFDSRVSQMVEQGKFSGDGPAVLKMQQEARAAFADYKAKFAKRGAGDTIGAAVEKILGKFSDTKATPDEVVRLAYGSAGSPGGQMPVQVAQRIAKIFGRDSREFATYKQGLFSHLTEGEPAKVAARIDEFLNGTKGKLLSQTVFTPQERSQLARYAERLRSTAVAGEPAATPSANKIMRDLMGASGTGTGVNAPAVAADLKARLSPEGWTHLRQMAFSELTSAGEGKIQFEAQALSQRLHEFLNEGGSRLAKVLYTPQELDLMRKLAAVYKQMIPVKGTTNPSGTAPMLSRMASNLRHVLLPLLGLTHGGLPGAAVAAVADRGLTAIGNANAARNATRLFYGDQPGRGVDPRFAEISGLLSQGAAVPAINQARRSK